MNLIDKINNFFGISDLGLTYSNIMLATIISTASSFVGLSISVIISIIVVSFIEMLFRYFSFKEGKTENKHWAKTLVNLLFFLSNAILVETIIQVSGSDGNTYTTVTSLLLKTIFILIWVLFQSLQLEEAFFDYTGKKVGFSTVIKKILDKLVSLISEEKEEKEKE